MNPFDLLKNAGAMQKQLEGVRAELRTVSATGSSGGNMVNVTVNGEFEIIAVRLDPIVVDNRDVPMLQDLIVAACHDAMVRVREAMQQKLGPMLGGMSVPGMGFPVADA